MDRITYTIRLDEDERDRWRDFVEESNEYSSTSQLVRRAVSSEIQRTDDEAKEGLSKEQKEAIDIFRNEIGRVLDVADDIKDLSERIKDSQVEPDQLREITFEASKEANNQQNHDLREFLKDE